MSARCFAFWFLVVEAIGASVWWGMLLGWPASRALFMAKDAPDSTLLAFGVADGILFIGMAAACAIGFWAGRSWAWPLLCVHAGAAGYAALYCWTLTMMTGGQAVLGAVLMTPSLFVPCFLAIRLRPRGAMC